MRGSWGLLLNQASLTCDDRLACDALAARFGAPAALFAPQHGMWSCEQANMIESPHDRHAALGIPIHSLYSDVRRPASAMLDGLDWLVIDLADVGTRVYTFLWTITYCLEACAKSGIQVLLLDRPNPLGAVQVEGPLLDTRFASFVGRASLPMRHGLTLGEAARLCNAEMALGAELAVVPAQGWRVESLFPATGLAWFPPSPNMPRWETALVYPGQVLLEGTCLSEGRGTTTPFEVCGAPFIDPERLVGALASFELPGVRFLPTWFRPTFDKWRGERCGGVFLRVWDPDRFRPFATTVAILAAVRALWPQSFRWLDPPYEYETEKWPIDILAGGDALRLAIDGGEVQTAKDVARLAELTLAERQSWIARSRLHWLYDRPGHG